MASLIPKMGQLLPLLAASMLISSLSGAMGLPTWVGFIAQFLVVLVLPNFLPGSGGGDIVGKTVPTDTLEALEYIQGGAGGGVSLAGKKPVVVELWATWCPPCRTSIPHIDKLYRAHGKDIDFVGVTNETDVKALEKFVGDMGDTMSYPVAMDSAGAVGRTMPVQGIPTAFIFVKGGQCVWQGHPSGLEAGIAVAKDQTKWPALIGNEGKKKD